MVGALIQQIDKARQKVYLDDRLHDLKKRVIDWRGHKPNQFGDLLLFGNLPVSSATRTQKVSYGAPPRARSPTYVCVRVVSRLSLPKDISCMLSSAEKPIGQDIDERNIQLLFSKARACCCFNRRGSHKSEYPG